MKVGGLVLAVMIVSAMTGCASVNVKGTSGSGAGGYYEAVGPDCNTRGGNSAVHSSSYDSSAVSSCSR